MALKNWNNIAGSLWSIAENWTASNPPINGDSVAFVPGSYTTIIDTAFLSGTGSPSFFEINLSVPGVTLDVQRSITVTQIDGDLSANGSANQNGLLEIGNGATLTYDSSIINTTNGNPGVGFYVKGDGVGAIGTLSVTGAIDTGGTLIADHINFDAAGGIVDSTAVLTLKNGATWTAQATETFMVGTVNLAGGSEANLGALPDGALTFEGSVPADQHVVMSNTNNELILPNTVDASSLTISGFGLTDKIEIAGVSNVRSATFDASQHLNFFSGINGGGSLLATLTGVTLAAGLPSTLDSSHFLIGTDATGTFVDLVSCFTPGTWILTSSGELKVEDLREGDLVMTKRNDLIEPRPIVWIGRRVIDLTRHPCPWMAAPIRISRGAIADNVPHRDLLLSPDHSVFIDGCLVPAKLLVNGATIVRELRATVEYFHVECESHSIILAEGLTVETYLDTGNRAMFDNAGLALLLHPQFEVNSSAKQWVDACAPLRVEADIVEPIWRRLKERSTRPDWNVTDTTATTADADIRVLVKGRELRPICFDNGRHVFVLPNDVAEVTLLSRTFCPSMERPWIDDQRQLGVALREVVFRGSDDFLTLPADVPHLTRGWWPAEDDGKAHWRWTNGAGVIALPFPARLMEVGIAMTALYPVDQTSWHRRLAA